MFWFFTLLRLGPAPLISVSLTVDAITGDPAFQNGRCHICFSLALDKVETGYNSLVWATLSLIFKKVKFYN